MKTPTNQGFVNQMLIYPLLAIGFTGGIGMGAVWMRHEISVVANENKAIETKIAAIGRLSQQTTTWIAEEQDYTELLRKNSLWHLGMVEPREEQVQRIGTDPMQYLASKNNKGLSRESIESVQFRIASQH